MTDVLRHLIFFCVSQLLAAIVVTWIFWPKWRAEVLDKIEKDLLDRKKKERIH